MKRDMNIIRLLLLQQEGQEVDLSSYTEDQLIYHAALLIEAGLVDGSIIPGEEGYPAMTTVNRMTWSGHDFLDAARNDSVWKKVTSGFAQKGLSTTFDLLKIALEKAILSQMGPS